MIEWKKNIKVNYKSIFKYDDHHETVQFKSDGIYEKGFDKEKFTFYNNDQKIEIILKGKEMTLANGPSLLNSFLIIESIGNHYHTDYGMIELFNRTYYNGTWSLFKSEVYFKWWASTN